MLGVLEDYATVVRRPGVPDVYVSENGLVRRLVGVDNNGVRISPQKR